MKSYRVYLKGHNTFIFGECVYYIRDLPSQILTFYNNDGEVLACVADWSAFYINDEPDEPEAPASAVKERWWRRLAMRLGVAATPAREDK